MPVKIPQLQQIQQSTNQGMQEQRIRGEALDVSGTVKRRASAIAGLAQQGAEMYVDYENDKIKQLSKAGENEYTFWYQSELSKLKEQPGDPTQAYNEFEQRADAKLEEIVNQNDDMSDRVKKSLRSYMSNVELKNRRDFHTQFGVQQQTYENTLYTDNIKMKQLNMSRHAGTSDVLFDAEMADMSDTIVERGLKRGIVEALPDDAESPDYVIRNADGTRSNYKLTNAAQLELVKHRSEALTGSVEALINAGQLDKAKALQDRVGQFIDPREKARLDKKYKKADAKETAYEFFDKNLRGKPASEQMAIIRQQKTELRDNLEKIKESFDSRRERDTKRYQKSNYDTLMKHVLKRQNGSNPYSGISDLEDDSVYKQTFENMSADQQETILSAIKAPKKTAPAAQAKIQDLIFGNLDEDIRDVSPGDFQTYLSGLNETDRNRYTRIYEKLNSETAGQERAFYKRSETFLKDEMLRLEVIEKNDYGKFDQEDEIKLIESRNDLFKYLSEREGVLDDAQLNKYVQDYVKAKVEEKAFTPPTFRRMRPARQADDRTPIKAETLDKNTMFKMKRKFKEKFGRFPKANDPQFQTFIQGEI